MRTRRLTSSNGLASQVLEKPTKALEKNQVQTTRESGHTSVLLHEVIEGLAIESTDVVLDATLGGAGHARELAAPLSGRGVFIGLDADQDAVDRARDALVSAKAPVHLQRTNFRELELVLKNLNIKHVDKVLFDLGWSSFQLMGSRGFSFQNDEPLIMTYDNRPVVSDNPLTSEWRLTAREVVNEWSEQTLADVIYGWGEERYARAIAKAIVDVRQRVPIETSGQLAEIISAALPSKARHGRIHPATKTFQALRIAVNDEFGALTQGLTQAFNALALNGRIAVISFHSTEDRIVKHAFREWANDGVAALITKKPIIPTVAEVRLNPRSRSAKLRIIQKLAE